MINLARHLKTLLCVCLTAGLFGCSATPSQTATWKKLEPYNPLVAQRVDPELYIQMASEASPEQRGHYQLLAADGLINHANIKQAKQLLHTATPHIFLPEDLDLKTLVSAKIDLFYHHPQRAKNRLHRLDDSTLSPLHRLTKLQLLAQSYHQAGQPTAALRTDLELFQALPTDSQRQTQTLAIWRNLQHAIPNTDNATRLTHGWIELANLNQQAISQPNILNSKLVTWQARHPEHPANTLIQPIPTSTAAPSKVAVLLPLQGPLGQTAQAIRDGILAAAFQLSPHPTIDIIDTSEGDITQLYNQAVAHGANWVIGPLSKKNLASLADNGPLSTPTIALNQLQNDSTDNLYQFSLSPEEEAQQVALQARRDGYQHVLIIQQDSRWGQRVASAFTQQWQTLNGQVADTVVIKPHDNLSQQIKHALKVDQSEENANQLRKISKDNLRFVPHRRQDIDAIFLAINHTQAHQIMPLLRYHFAGDITTYATSAIYSGTPAPYKDRDLNGIRFCDASWVLNLIGHNPSLSGLQHTLKTLWPKSYQRHARFYAFGIDAFQLINQLNRLQRLKHSLYPSASGDLSLADHGIIKRALHWAIMRNGSPHPFQPQYAANLSHFASR